MITQLRRRLKSKAARNIILWVILLTLSAGFLATILMRVFKLDKKVGGGFATVNGNELSVENFKMKMQENEQRINMLKKYFGQDADRLLKQMDMASDPRGAALQAMVNQELIDGLSDKLNIQLSSGYIDKKFSDKSFLQGEFGLIDFDQVIDPATGIIDNERLGYYLRMIGLTGDAFQEVLIKSLKREVLSGVAGNSYYVPEFEIRQKYIKDYISKKFEVLKFDFSSFEQEARKQEISSEDLKNFYDSENNNSKRYWVSEKRSGTAYYFDANSYGVLLPEDNIKKYYNENKINLFVKDPAKIQVRRILFKDGADSEKKAKETHSKLRLDSSKFASSAKELSDDKISAKDGGLIPMLSRGQRNEEFEKAAFSLKQDGDVSEVVKTKEGYEILQRVKRAEASYKQLEEVAGQIKEKLILSEFKKIFSGDMNKSLERGSFDDNKFNELIKKSVKNERIEPKALNDDSISSALFRIRDEIPAYYTDGKNGVVVKLDSVQAGHFPDLNSIKDKVSSDYYAKRASSNLNSVIKKAAQEAKTTDIAQLEKSYAGKYRVEIINTGFVKEDSAAKISELRAKGLPIDKILKLEVLGSTGNYRAGKKEISDGFVAKLQELEKFDDKQYLEKKSEIKKELIKLKNMAQLEEFIAFLRKKAIIKINK